MDPHVKNAEVFLANLQKAVRDRQPLFVAGGEFTYAELNSVALVLKRGIDTYKEPTNG